MKPGGGDGPHVFVDDLECPELRDEDLHHLTRSLRLRPGDTFTASDGAGSWRICRMGSVPEGEVEPVGEVVFVEAAQPPLTIGFALIKGGRPELVVQKLTELGVDAIVPFTAEHSVVRWEADRATRHTERLRRVAREAAMQSRQVRLPEIGEPTDFATLATYPGAIRADITGNAPSLDHPTVLIGPEGGWSETERHQLGAIRINSSVLRSETAAITTAALLTALRDGVIKHC
ncbi:16S rRNA (uracil(1498)-N(3))-methyltransferase [Candidatus Poriferisocius sp.]|uniref:16S rRNA (uracil(1498)-N(3))-methyltransferase n=1 Tax=Candidatus Poriferisocius sp. TaxID=3101276 RepID=UPI003B02BB0D